MTIRLLTQSDYPVFEAFLARHAPTSMFLRANARHAGLEFNGADYQAHYLGAFDGDALTGVLALCWNGSLLVQAPTPAALTALFHHAKQAYPSFVVKASSGASVQVSALLARVQPSADDIMVSREEGIFHLRLNEMIAPAELTSGRWTARLAREADLEIMAKRQVVFSAEGLGANQDDAALVTARADIAKWIADRRGFVLEDDGVIVAQCTFNARLPDIVQVGGVFTPPELRGRGYARGVVAGALRIAAGGGVRETLLFTQNPSAERAYRAIGYARVDDYYLALLRQGKPLSAAL